MMPRSCLTRQLISIYLICAYDLVVQYDKSIVKISEFVEVPAVKLAELSGVRESTLSKYFNKHRNPSYKSIEEMALSLNMKPEEILIGIRLRREKKKKLVK